MADQPPERRTYRVELDEKSSTDAWFANTSRIVPDPSGAYLQFAACVGGDQLPEAIVVWVPHSSIGPLILREWKLHRPGVDQWRSERGVEFPRKFRVRRVLAANSAVLSMGPMGATLKFFWVRPKDVASASEVLYGSPQIELRLPMHACVEFVHAMREFQDTIPAAQLHTSE